MRIKLISGPDHVKEALFGIGLSYGLTSDIAIEEFHLSPSFDRLRDRSLKLATMDGGHNKFLETITMTLDIDAPRFWWQEFDTYRVGVSKQSESTMHTIHKRPFAEEDFELFTPPEVINALNCIREDYLNSVSNNDSDQEYLFHLLKNNLPEGYLQRRIVSINAKSLRTVYHQRKTHRLKQWHIFFDKLVDQMIAKSYGRLVTSYIIEVNK